MRQNRLPIEYKSNVKTTNLDYYVMLEDHLHQLAKEHDDISRATAKLERYTKGKQDRYEADITLYAKPYYINAHQESDDPHLAMQGAIDSLKRQVRELKERMRQNRGLLNDVWVAPLNIDSDTNTDNSLSNDTVD